MISSKDAYMLIYAKKTCSVLLDASDGPSNGVEQFPQPPARALKVVHSLNASHDALCEKFQIRYVPSTIIIHKGLQL
jgi:hypothetical protein